MLTFQGITVSNGLLIVATLEGDLLKIGLDGTVTKWVNLSRSGIPAGLVNVQGTIVVTLSAQESGHFLMQVTPEGKVTLVADLSMLAGEFGAPFGIAAHSGYYPYYWVAVVTDVVRTGGLIARVTPSGKISELVKLPSSPFGIAAKDDRLFVTQEDGTLLQISQAGQVRTIVNLSEAGLGIPLAIAESQNNCLVTTDRGLLVKLAPDGRLLTVVNVLEAGFGLPTTLTALNDSYVAATTLGNLLRIMKD
ncbi:hypothetical protein [Phormidesmis priestleyi]